MPRRFTPLLVGLACLITGCGDPPPSRSESTSPPAEPAALAPSQPPAPAPTPQPAQSPAPAPTPAAAAPAPPPAPISQTLFDFEQGTQGWYAYAHEATLTLASGDGGAAGSAHALQVEFTPGKGGSYLGMGVVVMAGAVKAPWADYAGGHLALSIRSDCACGVGITIDATDKTGYGLRIASTSAGWTTYQLPFASFTGKSGRFDPASAGIARISITPGGHTGKTGHVWFDGITLSNQPVALPTEHYQVAARACDATGAPLPGIRLGLMRTADGVVVGSGTSDAGGACTMPVTNALVAYLSDPPAEGSGSTDLPVQLHAEGDGLVPAVVPAIIKPGANSLAITVKAPAKALPPLHVDGNRLRDPAGAEVWLQGVCIDSLEWSAGGERILTSVPVAIDLWKANVVRLPVKAKYWFGTGEYQKDGGEAYRRLVDTVRDECRRRGAYLALDLHGFGAPTAADAAFWKAAAEHFKDDPVVIFELFNEPHDIPWEVWRNGGDTEKSKHDDQQVVQNTIKTEDKRCVGMQALVDAIRSTGAKNLLAAGGLGWSYDLSGVVNGFALQDTADGQGIMYVWHTYPWSHWKVGWQKAVLDAAAQYPILVSEVGNIRRWEDFSFIKQGERVEDITTGDWPRDILGLIQTHRLNWTGFSFHVTCGPPMISDWSYTPNDYWGVYVKRALAGEKFELKRVR